MSSILRYKQFIFGLLIGGWIVFFFVRAMVFQEFSGLEAAGNATYIQLRNEALDDFLLVPMFFMLPITLISLAALLIMEGYAKLKRSK